jgi:hypothetical protein
VSGRNYDRGAKTMTEAVRIVINLSRLRSSVCCIFAGAFCCRAATDEIDPETKFFTPENAASKPQVLCLSSA